MPELVSHRGDDQAAVERRRAMPCFLFRCDVSPIIGTGHLRRCLTLARELKEYGASVFIACRSVDFDWAKDVRCVADGLTALEWSLTPESDVQDVIRLYQQREMDVAVIDHYRADVEYQQLLYRSGVRWLQFDWSARQPLWADWVLNASPAAEESAYLSLKQRDQTRLLLGPAYAPIRREFRQWRPHVRLRDQVCKILLAFGGGDDRGATVFCLEAIKPLDPAIERVVLVSSVNPRLSDVVDWVGRNNSSNVTLLVDEQEIARYMASADLAIIAGGVTTFETAAMGLPSLIVQLADNQSPNANAWERAGVAIAVGSFGSLRSSVLKYHVSELIKDSEQRNSMANAGRALVDCLGAHRVARALLSGR